MLVIDFPTQHTHTQSLIAVHDTLEMQANVILCKIFFKIGKFFKKSSQNCLIASLMNMKMQMFRASFAADSIEKEDRTRSKEAEAEAEEEEEEQAEPQTQSKKQKPQCDFDEDTNQPENDQEQAEN